MWCTVGITLESDGGHRDGRNLGEPLVETRVDGLPLGKPKAPTIVVDYDADVIRIGEGRCAARKRGIVELPLRGGELPDELREVVTVLVVAGSTALGGEVELVPPLELCLGRQGNPPRFLAADQVAADGNACLAALGPQRGDDVGAARSPVEAAED